MSKIRNGPVATEEFGKRPYWNLLTLEGVRTKFRLRSKMTDVKFNYRSNKKYSSDLWKCDSCMSAIETQDHILWWPSYSGLREGKNLSDDKDLTDYFRKVLIIRDRLNISK